MPIVLVPIEKLTNRELDQLAAERELSEPEHAAELKTYKRLRTQYRAIARKTGIIPQSFADSLAARGLPLERGRVEIMAVVRAAIERFAKNKAP